MACNSRILTSDELNEYLKKASKKFGVEFSFRDSGVLKRVVIYGKKDGESHFCWAVKALYTHTEAQNSIRDAVINISRTLGVEHGEESLLQTTPHGASLNMHGRGQAPISLAGWRD